MNYHLVTVNYHLVAVNYHLVAVNFYIVAVNYHLRPGHMKREGKKQTVSTQSCLSKVKVLFNEKDWGGGGLQLRLKPRG